MMKKEYKIIGLMSGTSLDGLDVAYVHFCYENEKWNYEILHAENFPYSAEWQEKLRNSYYQTAEGIAALDAEYGRYLGQKVKRFFKKIIYRKLILSLRTDILFFTVPI